MRRPARRVAVEEVEPGDGVAAPGFLRFFDDGKRLALRVKVHHAIALRVRHAIAKNRAAAGQRVGAGQHVGHSVAEEDVVAEDHDGRIARQKILRQKIGLRQPVRARLGDELKPHPPLRAVVQQSLKLRLIVGRRDDRDLPHPGQHQDGERVVYHRFVIDRQKLL